MAELRRHLNQFRPELVRRAVRGLGRGEMLREPLEAEAARFFDRLSVAVESGSLEWLHRLMDEWVASRPEDRERSGQSFLPLLHTLRACTWELLADRLPPQEAVESVVALEKYFAGASLYLTQIEREAQVGEMEAELGVARARLEKLDRSKSDFIAVAAHELKTPLTLIEGYAQLLADEVPRDEYPRVNVHLRGLGNGTDRLKEIIEDMIDVSLIDNDLLALTYEPVRLAELLDRARSPLEPTLRKRRLNYEQQDVPGDLLTYADPVRLRQVFANLLENAVKFTPDGGQITLRSRQLPGFIELTVSDTGIGIAADDLQRIFGKFGPLGDVWLHSSSKTKFKGGGPGLGLLIARGIVQAHGGTVWAESPGYDEKACPGSTFHIMLPHLTQPPPDKTSKLFSPFPAAPASLHRPTPDQTRPH